MLPTYAVVLDIHVERFTFRKEGAGGASPDCSFALDGRGRGSREGTRRLAQSAGTERINAPLLTVHGAFVATS